MLNQSKTILFDIPEVTLFRARYLKDPASPFSKPSDLMAPPVEAIKAYGRCNYPNQSVFYGANNIPTMFAEMRASKGDHFQYFELKTLKQSSIRVGFVGLIDHYRRYGSSPAFFGVQHEEIEDTIKSIQSSLSQDEWKKLLLVDAFLSDWFRRKIGPSDNIDYNLTAAFTNFHFEQPVDALVYPSVAHLGGWNIAIKPSVSLEKFTIVTGGIYKLNEDLGYGLYNASAIKSIETISTKGFTWFE